MDFLPTNIIEQSSNKMKNVNIKPKKYTNVILKKMARVTKNQI